MLREALGRLQATAIVTNIRVAKGKKQRQFSWIESWTDHIDDETQQSRGMSLTLSDWFYEGILMDGGLLSIDPEYFSITGGRERWLYRVARKHAGGAGEGGFAISCPPCSRNQALKAPTVASSSRSTPLSGTTTCPASSLRWNSPPARNRSCA